MTNLPVLFPFFENIDHQTHRLRWCEDENLAGAQSGTTLWQFWTDMLEIPPFIIRAGFSESPTVFLHQDETFYWDITAALGSELSVCEGTGSYYIKYLSSYNIEAEATIEGFEGLVSRGDYEFQNVAICGSPFYLRVKYGEVSYYSDLFWFVDGVSVPSTKLLDSRISITATDSRIVGDIEYNLCPFAQKIYLPTDVGRPTYKFVDEGEDDGEGSFRSYYRRLTKEYQAQFICPEHIADGLAAVQLHDEISIIDQYGTGGSVRDFKVEFDWAASGCVALCTLRYTRDFVRTKVDVAI